MCNTVRRIALMASIVLFGLTIFASGGQLRAQDEVGQETLTNADVVKMVQAHLRADVIVDQIQNSRCKFSLTTSSLIQLKQANVPDKVIEAMQAKSSTSRLTAPAGGSSSPARLDSEREYTVTEFERLLPEILSKAAIAHGLGAHGYDKEADYIKQTLDTCALTGNVPDPKNPKYENRI
jgi:hypothetical protein